MTFYFVSQKAANVRIAFDPYIKILYFTSEKFPFKPFEFVTISKEYKGIKSPNPEKNYGEGPKKQGNQAGN